MLVLVENAAEAVTVAYVQAGDLFRTGTGTGTGTRPGPARGRAAGWPSADRVPGRLYGHESERQYAPPPGGLP
jgi:hypothetical protein